MPWRVAAAAWLLLVLAVGLHQWSFWREGRLDTDILALLPQDEQTPALAEATRRWADRGSRQVVVLIGAPDWPDARAAAAAWEAAMDGADRPLRPAATMAAADARAALEFYRPWRDRLLTADQRRHLTEASPDLLARQALTLLLQPGAGGGTTDWLSDPLGLWSQWWSTRGVRNGPTPRDGRLALSAEGRQWVLLMQETAGPAFSLSGNAALAEALAAAEGAALHSGPGVRVLAIGVPLYAEAAAVQASREINLIGWGSLGAVLLLVWLAFRSLRPIVLVGLSLLVGTAVALSATALVFGKVHLLTLVFGASLVGVAEDYGIHYFASRQGDPRATPRGLMRQLLPGLAMALATSVLAYLLLGVAPFPGLRQMALFSAVGLAAAFLTVVCWFPVLDRGRVPNSRFAEAIAASLHRWPRWTWQAAGRRRAPRAALVVAAALFCAGGWWQLRASDDIRQLQNPPAELLRVQREMARLLPVPSAAQFYLVQGADTQELLEREEALKARLAPLVDSGVLAGVGAVSDWVPSLRRQHADAGLTARAERAVLQMAGQAVGEELVRPDFATADLAVSDWLAQPVARLSAHLWLGDIAGRATSIVMLQGLGDYAALPQLSALAQGLPGVLWVNKPVEVSSLLQRYRHAMTALLVAGHVVTLLALWWRFRRSAWRAWLPALLATGLTLAALGWLGEPLQLFNILALMLLLGIGVDYGIFLLEHRGDGSAWLAVVLGAASTWLAFGLLGLSATPALRAFGLTLLIGIALVWMLCPLLRQAGDGAAP